jgi:hypothetical protein
MATPFFDFADAEFNRTHAETTAGWDAIVLNGISLASTPGKRVWQAHSDRRVLVYPQECVHFGNRRACGSSNSKNGG